MERVVAVTDLRNDFAGLRAEEIARIKPPGAAAVRATVRRRRLRHRSASGALAVLLLAGGFATIDARDDGKAVGDDRDVTASPAPDEFENPLAQRVEEVIATSGAGSEV